MNYSERMRRVREAMHLSQKEFAIEVGVAHNTVSGWEHGRSKPSPENVERIIYVVNTYEKIHGLRQLIG